MKVRMEDKKQIISIELIKEKSNGMIQNMSINGVQLHLAQNGTGGPVIFWGMYPHQPNEVEHLWESLLELVPEQNFLLVAFQVEPGLFPVGSIGCIRKGRLRRTRSEDAEMADRGMCATY